MDISILMGQNNTWGRIFHGRILNNHRMKIQFSGHMYSTVIFLDFKFADDVRFSLFFKLSLNADCGIE